MNLLDEQTREWERLPKETEKAWVAFSAWLELEMPRTEAKLIKKTGVVAKSIFDWKRKYNWHARTLAYDRFMGRKIDDAAINAYAAFKARVIQDEADDYALLEATWKKMFDKVLLMGGVDLAETLNNLLKLSKMRLTIDNMARKASQLPNSYSARLDLNDVTETTPELIELSINGPKFYIGEGEKDEETDDE